jgi:hypothetical protein
MRPTHLIRMKINHEENQDFFCSSFVPFVSSWSIFWVNGQKVT